jgi:hypothetical protein
LPHLDFSPRRVPWILSFRIFERLVGGWRRSPPWRCTLALGIGANTVVFGMVNSVLLRRSLDRPEQLKDLGAVFETGIPRTFRARCGSATAT